MRLRPSGPADAAVVAGWPASATERRLWCGQEEVTATTVTGWSAADDVLGYGLTDDGALIGYGELWLDDDEREVELARIIVAPGRRGRGAGRFLATAPAVPSSDADELRCRPGAGHLTG